MGWWEGGGVVEDEGHFSLSFTSLRWGHVLVYFNFLFFFDRHALQGAQACSHWNPLKIIKRRGCLACSQLLLSSPPPPSTFILRFFFLLVYFESSTISFKQI